MQEIKTYSYLYRYYNKKWIFINTDTNRKSNKELLEIWYLSNNKRYLFCNIYFDKFKVDEEDEKNNYLEIDFLSKNNGIDLYHIINECTNEILIRVWKPDILRNNIEITLSDDIYKIVNQDITVDELKKEIQDLLQLEIIEIDKQKLLYPQFYDIDIKI